MYAGIAKALAKYWSRAHSGNIEVQYKNYLGHGYPSNHTYKISKEKLVPKHKLAKRFKKIRALYPAPLTSLAEIGCSKGFFVLSAHESPHCSRSLGIDITQYDIDVCRWVKTSLQNTQSTFELMQLHELAEQIETFGGPFQTLLILNTYQYLYFGSDRFSARYLSHDLIFKYFRKICSGRIIFNNRIELKDCQNANHVAEAGPHQKLYSEEHMITAASTYFSCTKHGAIGKYPLYTFDAL